MSDKKIMELAGTIVALQNEAVRKTLLIFEPKVYFIIQTKSQNIDDIERTIEALIEVAFNDKVLILLKKLCRYYYDIDSKATVEYISIYREVWDNDSI